MKYTLAGMNITMPLTLTDQSTPPGFERLILVEDTETNLTAFICIHSTACGPAAGGCRVWDYPNRDAAQNDACRLAEGMSYKNAIAGVGLGGGKSVIWADRKSGKSDALLRSFGRAVNSLEGRYYTAEDVGMSTRDMAVVAEETAFAVGLEGGAYASGDPSPFTAEGVFQCLKTGADHVFGTADLTGRRVLVQGLGHVGMSLTEKLAAAGAALIVSDINEIAVEQAKNQFGAIVCPVDQVFTQEMDIFAPCALGGVLNDETVPQLRARMVCGAANNQLATDETATQLQARGITYLPDYIANAGGIISVAGEIHQQGPGYRQGKLGHIAERMRDILTQSRDTGRPTDHIAYEMATHIIADARSAKETA